MIILQKRFKRLKRIEDDDSGNEEQEGDEGEDREAIANQLFEGGSDHVSKTRHFDRFQVFNLGPYL